MEMDWPQISKNRVSIFGKLARKKHRDAARMFVAEGHKCVTDTLGHFRPVALVASAGWLGKYPAVASHCAGVTMVATERDLAKISQMSDVPDVMAVYEYPDWYTADVPKPREDGLYLALDGVQDPGNLGTIVRAADWFGVRHIYASRQTADIFGAKAVQATMGAVARVQVHYCDLPRLLAEAEGIPLFGTLLDGENIYEAGFDAHSGIIILGNEGNGLTEEVRALLTERLLIPPFPAGSADHPESLNVGVSAAIVLAEFRRRLTSPSPHIFSSPHNHLPTSPHHHLPTTPQP